MEIRVPDQLYNRVMEYLAKQPLAETYQIFTDLVVAKNQTVAQQQAAQQEASDGVRTETD